MFEISKAFTFAAAHHLPKLPISHKCHRPHGHNYTVIVTLRFRKLDSHDFVLDYGDMKPIKDWLDDNFDHRDLNDIVASPTAEVLAEFLFGVFEKLVPFIYSVTVKETENTTATFWRSV